MIFCQAVSSYQLLELLTYKIVRYDKKEAMFFMPTWLFNKIKNINFLEKRDIKIVSFDNYNNYNYQDSEIIDNDIVNYYDNIFNQLEVDLDTCEEINIAGAHYGIGSYLCLKKIEFNLWEDAAGVAHKLNSIFFKHKYEPMP